MNRHSYQPFYLNLLEDTRVTGSMNANTTPHQISKMKLWSVEYLSNKFGWSIQTHTFVDISISKWSDWNKGWTCFTLISHCDGSIILPSINIRLRQVIDAKWETAKDAWLMQQNMDAWFGIWVLWSTPPPPNEVEWSVSKTHSVVRRNSSTKNGQYNSSAIGR